nr:hypothetical protein IPBHJEJL_00035 [Klebsiella oxytoca]
MSFRAVSTADLLANKLRQMINNGSLRDGERLVERDLASHFDVSRIPMREAIRQLEHEGLVEIFRNRGAIVRTLSVDDLNEIYQLRSLLEGEAIFQSVNNLSADNLARAGLTHSLLASCTKFELQGQLNREFHDLLYSGCENHRLLTVFDPIFPDTCYHLTHYWYAAADIPVASDNPAHYADAIRYNARTLPQGSLLPLTRRV